MADEPNTTQDTSTADSPPTPEAMDGQTPLTTPSDTPEIAPGAPEASGDGFTPESPNTPVSTTPSETSESEKQPETGQNIENQASPTPEPVQATEPQTAQIPVNEPFTPEPEVKSEPLEHAPVSAPQPQPVSAPVFVEPQQNKTSLARELLVKARNMIQFRKRKKLDRVMTLFLKKSKITNDEVEKFLHVSDATATRYLSILENEGRIKQNGKTGHMVSYSRI